MLPISHLIFFLITLLLLCANRQKKIGLFGIITIIISARVTIWKGFSNLKVILWASPVGAVGENLPAGSLVREGPTCHGATKPRATTIEACALEPRATATAACTPDSLCSATEAATVRSPHTRHSWKGPGIGTKTQHSQNNYFRKK